MSSDPQATPPARETARSEPPAWRGWAMFAAALVAVFLLGLLAASILQRREEALRQRPLQPIADPLTDSANWQVNYPREYDRYLMMRETTSKTKYGGADPRDYLNEVPTNIVLFAGYGFAKGYLQARGHLWTIDDVTESARIDLKKTPATCWTCKSPDVIVQMEKLGVEQFYAQKFADFQGTITHPIGCLDCHDPNTMQLRITRPALKEALKRQGVREDEISHQEMRSLVCAQCHVEYYFRGKGNYLTFPWDKGTRIEQVEQYYDEEYKDGQFSDWVHAISKAPMLKMQHPDYEIYKTGVHAYRDVSCADCHMPYRSEGGVKYTDHYIQSPLLNVANSCAVCHRWGEQEIVQRVEAIQDKVFAGRQRAEDAVSKAHFDIAACMQAGAKDEELRDVRRQVREAQTRWDFVAAHNGMGFHSPQECQRILGEATYLAGQCRVECARILAKHGVTDPVRYPEYDTKEKATAVIKTFIDGKDVPELIARPAEAKKE